MSSGRASRDSGSICDGDGKRSEGLRGAVCGREFSANNTREGFGAAFECLLLVFFLTGSR